MNKHATLDRYDLKILAALQQDGRIPFQRLSELVNLTPRPCLERVRRMEKAGIIQGYTAIIVLPEQQPGVVLLAQVALGEHGNSQRKFAKMLEETPEVLDAWLIGGNFDFMLRIGCRDLNAYRELAECWLASDSFKVEKIQTISIFQEVKRCSLPLPAQAA